MNGQEPSTANGISTSDHIAQHDLDQLLQALEAIYNPRSSNDLRKQATLFLDRVKTNPSAPASGFALATDRSRPHIVRHYGLSMLEYAIKYRWVECDAPQQAALRSWVIELAEQVSHQDPSFLRNKIAQVWAEIAKRGWIPDWKNMDQLLYELFKRSFIHQEIVLHVLETLSDESFAKEDYQNLGLTGTGIVRHQQLGRACVEIFTPAAVWAEVNPDVNPDRSTSLGVRYGDEGWIQRLTEALKWCLDQGVEQNEDVKNCALKIFNVLRSALSWLSPKAIRISSCVDLCAQYLSKNNLALRLGATEAFHALYHRPPNSFEDADVVAIVCPLLSTNGIDLLRQTYEQSCTSLEDLDEIQYSMLKKLTEFICALAAFIECKPQITLEHIEADHLLRFLATVLQNVSLVVSIPILYIWTKLLATPQVIDLPIVPELIPGLLEVCSLRLIRYENLASDASDPTLQFLQEDFDTVPERHAFMGNYRRFCQDLIERIVAMRPIEAVRHLIGQATDLIQNLYSNGESFSPESFSNNSMPLVTVDAKVTVVQTALKGYMRWYQSKSKDSSDTRAAHAALQDDLEAWCKELLQINFQDPAIEKKIFQLVIETIQIVLGKDAKIVLDVCEHVFSQQPRSKKDSTGLYEDAIRELESAFPRELQKLAIRSSNVFLSVYPDLEQGVNKYTSSDAIETRLKLDYQAFLFIIIQRTTAIDANEKGQRIGTMLQKVVDQWKDPSIAQALESFEGFCTLLKLEQYPDFFLNAKAWSISDWSTIKLPEEAKQIREKINARTDELPLLPTRTFLSASTERVKVGTPDYEIVKAQWCDAVPLILPSVLRIVGYSHAFTNIENWSSFPKEMQEVVRRTLVDRVWQSGISNESRDDFYARVRESKYTLEGFASAVRAAVRNVRELSYWILHCMSHFGDAFYAHSELPEAVATALYKDAHTLSPHQLSTLLRLTSALINGCPTHHRGVFLPPLLTILFSQLDSKIMSDYEVIERRKAQTASDEALDAEMKAESVLRQLTYAAASLITSLLVPTAPQPNNVDTIEEVRSKQITVRAILLTNPAILRPLFLFCTHLLSIHDHRCVTQVIRTLRDIIPEFAPSGSVSGTLVGIEESVKAQAREYISSSLLESAITSLNDPYFTEVQRDVAYLIASILSNFATSTSTPRSVLLSLAGMTEERVDQALTDIDGTQSERVQRGVVLDLLEGVRGRSIFEEGRIQVAQPKKKESSKWARQDGGMAVEGKGIERGGSPEGGAITALFG